MKKTLAAGTLAASIAALAQTPPPQPPCPAPQSRQFDFWVGDWDVFMPDGKKSGELTM